MENRLEKDVVQENIRVNALLNSNVCELVEECKCHNKNIDNRLDQTKNQLLTTMERSVADFKEELTRSTAQMSKDMQEKINKEQQKMWGILDKNFKELKEELKKSNLKGDKEAENSRKVLEERTQKVLFELEKAAAAASNDIQKVENQIRTEAKRTDENAVSLLAALGKTNFEILSSSSSNTELLRKDLKAQTEQIENVIKHGFEQVWSLYGKIEVILFELKKVQEESSDRLKKSWLFSGGAMILGIINILLILAVLGQI